MSSVMFTSVEWSMSFTSIDNLVKNIAPNIDVHPIYNRRLMSLLFGGANPSKHQAIINSIFEGYDIGEITLAQPGEKFPHEVLDGSNRVSAILGFRNNKFPIHESCSFPELRGLWFKDLPEHVQAGFLAYQIRLLYYKNLTNETKGEHFRLRNGGTPVNKMEMLNAYGRIPIADMVRSTAGIVPGEPTKPHTLFHSTMPKTNGVTTDVLPTWTYLAFPNVGRRHDEMVARITYMMYRGGVLVPCDHRKDQLIGMYTDRGLTVDKVASISKKVDDCLDFILAVANAKINAGRKKGLETHEVTMLYRWYVHFTHLNGPFKMINADKFYDAFHKTMQCFINKDSSKWVVQGSYGSKLSSRPISGPKGAFISSLGQHSSLQRMIKTYEWFTVDAGFDPVADGSIVRLDRQKFFSEVDITNKWTDQNYTCAITGDPLRRIDAEGAHIKARSLGGTTTVDNLAVVHRDHNRAMGTMSVDEYREVWLRKNAA